MYSKVLSVSVKALLGFKVIISRGVSPVLDFLPLLLTVYEIVVAPTLLP